MQQSPRRTRALLAFLAVLAVATAACGEDTPTTADGKAVGDVSTTTAAPDPDRVLKISAIPDQDPAKLTAINTAMAGYLTTALGRTVEYVPVTDYAASVSLFKTGDLDVVFFGGLTGVQARLQTPNATLLAQRDIDDAFQTVFIASKGAGVGTVDDVAGLTALKGKRFTFGSESSTSGRLMPEYFLDQAGLASATDFSGPAGFSGSHDKTIDLVQAGTYDAGALNLQVWKKRKEAGTVDLTKVDEVLVSPPYHDYHWIAGPETDDRFGAGFADEISEALLALDYTDPEQAKLLDLYGAKKFIATSAGNYKEIEQIARKLDLIVG
jgi:phosphonate transport system substrate-binding protein